MMVMTGKDKKCKVGCPTREDFRKAGFLKVAEDVEKMRKKLDLKSEQAIFLGIVRDMAVNISKRSKTGRVWELCREIGFEFGGFLV